MYCNKCFAEIPDGSTRCPNCGANLAEGVKGKKKPGRSLFGGSKKKNGQSGGMHFDANGNLINDDYPNANVNNSRGKKRSGGFGNSAQPDYQQPISRTRGTGSDYDQTMPLGVGQQPGYDQPSGFGGSQYGYEQPSGFGGPQADYENTHDFRGGSHPDYGQTAQYERQSQFGYDQPSGFGGPQQEFERGSGIGGDPQAASRRTGRGGRGPKFNPKILLILGGSLVLLAGLIIGILLFVRNRGDNNVSKKSSKTASVSVTDDNGSGPQDSVHSETVTPATTSSASTSSEAPTPTSAATQTPTPVTESTNSAKSSFDEDTPDSFFWPDSNSRLYTYEDLGGLSKEQIEFIKAEIYAREGCIFKDKKYVDYFKKKNWYKGSVEEEKFDMNKYLNYYELENVRLIDTFLKEKK